MPNYKTHLFGGLSAYLLTLCTLNITVFKPVGSMIYFSLAACLLGSVFPDIDTKSKVQRLIYILLIFLLVYLYLKNDMFAFIAIAIGALFPLIVNHRTIFHNPKFLIALSCIAYFCLKSYFPAYSKNILILTIFFAVGCITHLILDSGIKNTFKKFGI